MLVHGHWPGVHGRQHWPNIIISTLIHEHWLRPTSLLSGNAAPGKQLHAIKIPGRRQYTQLSLLKLFSPLIFHRLNNYHVRQYHYIKDVAYLICALPWKPPKMCLLFYESMV